MNLDGMRGKDFGNNVQKLPVILRVTEVPDVIPAEQKRGIWHEILACQALPPLDQLPAEQFWPRLGGKRPIVGRDYHPDLPTSSFGLSLRDYRD